MKNINRISNTTMSIICIMVGPQGWADLPDGLLYSILLLLGSIRDLLAFSATCPSWRAAFMSMKFTLDKIFPPAIFRNCADQTSPADSRIGNTLELIDLAYPSTPLRRLIPPSILDTMDAVKCSYGHAIFSSDRSIVIMDVLTGTTVAAPSLPSIQLCNITFISPEASPDSYLFVSSPLCLYAWRVGSPTWLHRDFLHAHLIHEMVAFKGQIIARTSLTLYAVHFTPRFHLKALKVACSHNIDPTKLSGKLVACEDMLLLVSARGEAFSIDFSTEPAKYVRVADGVLSKWAFFFDKKTLGQPRLLVNPERIGLRGGHVYQLDQNTQVFSYPADGRQDGELLPEPCLTTINTHLAHNSTSYASWV